MASKVKIIDSKLKSRKCYRPNVVNRNWQFKARASFESRCSFIESGQSSILFLSLLLFVCEAHKNLLKTNPKIFGQDLDKLPIDYFLSFTR